MQVDVRLLEQLSIHDSINFEVWPEAKPKQSQPCTHAQEFESWAKAECREALASPTFVKLNVAMLQVFKSYMIRRARLPKSHRYHVGERGHRCLWHVLESIYEQLSAAELKLGPPRLFVPLPPPPPPPQPPIPPPPLYKDVFINAPK
jgi:hypothetical protein